MCISAATMHVFTLPMVNTLPAVNTPWQLAGLTACMLPFASSNSLLQKNITAAAKATSSHYLLCCTRPSSGLAVSATHHIRARMCTQSHWPDSRLHSYSGCSGRRHPSSCNVLAGSQADPPASHGKSNTKSQRGTVETKQKLVHCHCDLLALGRYCFGRHRPLLPQIWQSLLAGAHLDPVDCNRFCVAGDRA